MTHTAAHLNADHSGGDSVALITAPLPLGMWVPTSTSWDVGPIPVPLGCGSHTSTSWMWVPYQYFLGCGSPPLLIGMWVPTSTSWDVGPHQYLLGCVSPPVPPGCRSHTSTSWNVGPLQYLLGSGSPPVPLGMWVPTSTCLQTTGCLTTAIPFEPLIHPATMHQQSWHSHGYRGAGIAQWLERRTHDRKVAGLKPC